MEKTKLLTIAVIGLLLLNLGTLAFMWLGKKPPPRDMRERGEGGRPPAAAFLIKELNFDENQTVVYDRLRILQRKSQDSLQNVLRQNREVFFKGMPTRDSSKITTIGDIQKQFDMATFNHFREVRALCRPDQQTKFDSVIEDVLKMMAPKQRPR